MAKTKLLLSAGHDSVRVGARSPDGKYKEEVVAMILRNRVGSAIKALGGQYEVLMDTVPGGAEAGAGAGEDSNAPLREAIKLAAGTKIAVEFHLNASENTAATGIEALCHDRGGNKVIAQELCKAIAGATGIKTRGGDSGWKPANSGQHPRLGFCEAGGIILEVCFISNPLDMELYVANKIAVAMEIADVLHRHMLQGAG